MAKHYQQRQPHRKAPQVQRGAAAAQLQYIHEQLATLLRRYEGMYRVLCEADTGGQVEGQDQQGG